jgi:hypothetical protein
MHTNKHWLYIPRIVLHISFNSQTHKRPPTVYKTTHQQPQAQWIQNDLPNKPLTQQWHHYTHYPTSSDFKPLCSPKMNAFIFKNYTFMDESPEIHYPKIVNIHLSQPLWGCVYVWGCMCGLTHFLDQCPLVTLFQILTVRHSSWKSVILGCSPHCYSVDEL